MKQITGKRLAQEIERGCRKDLDTIEQSGIPRAVVIFIAVRAAERRFDVFTPETREACRNRVMEYRDGEARAAKFLESIENLRNKGCAIEGLPGPLQPQAWRDSRKKLGEYLREHGRANHDQAIPILVSSILEYRPRFDCWKALARVLRVAYVAAGRVTPDADTLRTALLRAAARIR
jgi:hypothetical protein